MRNKIIIAAAALAGVYFLSHAVGHVQTSTLAGIVIFFVALGVSFVRGVDALYIIIFAMLFSPEIGTPLTTGRTSGGEGVGAITLRLEDILLIAVGCGWLLRTAYQKRQFGIIRTAVNPAIGLYIIVCIVATMLGVVGGTVHLEAGIVHNLKFFEYFFLFFMILAHVRKKAIINRMFIALLVVFFLALIYGYTQIELTGGKRVSAPFENEPNTFGGYIVLLMCVAFGIILADQRIKVRWPLVFLLIFALPPLLFTLSRASYMAFITACLTFLVVSSHRIIVGAVIVGVTAAMLIGVPMLPDKVQQRITGTFEAQPEYHVQIAGVDLDSSASARIVSFQAAIKLWEKSPVLGLGVTGTHFIDGQYFRLLAETGIAGLAAFLFVLWRLLRETWKIYKQCEENFLKGAVLGFFCGVIAVMAHALSANSFIIIRIAEPLWLMAGLILLIPKLSAAEDGADLTTDHTDRHG